MKLKALPVALLGAVLMSASLASAANAAVTLNYLPSFGSTENTGASATANFVFSDVGANVRVDLTLSNITNGLLGLGATNATLVGIAFDAPTATFVSYTGAGGFTKAWTNPSLPPYGNFDFGVSPERNSFVGGNPQSGLTAGGTPFTVSFVLDTSFDAAAFESAFLAGYTDGTFNTAARFQQVNAGGGSDKVLGGITSAVPEPATWAMMITGFGLAGAALRQRRRQAVFA